MSYDRRVRVFCSCATYYLGKWLGLEDASRVFVAECQSPGRFAAHVPAARVINRVGALGHDVELMHLAATELSKLRSRAYHQAVKSSGEVWLTVDDDVECDSTALGALLDVVNGFEPRIAILPCVMRGGEQLNVRYSESSLRLELGGHTVRLLEMGGTGLLVANRAALNAFSSRYAEDNWRDEDGELKVAAFDRFRERGGPWFGEDYSFCRRARDAGIGLYAITEGVSSHDGQALALDRDERTRA